MKFSKKVVNLIVRCVVICMIFPQLLPILSYAESSETTLTVGDNSILLSIQPYVNDLGIMIDASEITKAFGMSYQLDAENKTFTIFDEKHGEIVLMHNATKFYSGEKLYNCAAYFYIENTIPMIELGFFCDMFDSSYQYDEETNTISVNREKISDETPKIRIGDKIVSIMNEPFVGEYGLVAGAEDIANAFGLKYTYNETTETATFYDDKHGNVVLVNGATSFKSGGCEFKCLPYFYLSNGTPVITVDFFCRMYDAEYQYDRATKTLELFTSEEIIAENAISLFSVPTISGKISYAPGVSLDTIPVKIVLQPFKFDLYENIISGSKIELGTVTLNAGETTKNYSYKTSALGEYPYYYLYYESPDVGKYGYYSTDGETVQRITAPELENTTTAKRFSSNVNAQANLVVDYNQVYGDITLAEKPPASGLNVKIILQQGDIRGVKYEQAYLIPGETHTLGSVCFNSSETKKQYNYITTEYYSEQYPYYSLFFEAPAISKYGYYNNAQGTTVLDSAVDYDDAKWYTAATTEVIPLYSKRQLNLNIKSSVNLNGILSVDTGATIPNTGLEVTLYLENVKKQQYIYNGTVISNGFYADKRYELETFHLTNQNPTASFAFDTYKWTTLPYYHLLYRVKNAQDSVVAAGFVNENGDITGVEVLDRYYGAPYRYSVDETADVSIKLPAFVYQPCGTDSYWTLDTVTGTLNIKGTGAVTNNSWKLLSEYITTVKVSPGITSLSANMPMNIVYLYLPDTITDIGYSVFSYCSKLKDVIYSGNKEEWSDISIGASNSYLTSANIIYADSDNVSVIYYTNGSSNSPESVEVKKNSTVKISSAIPTREGFEFLGWATTQTATIPQYKPGTTVTVGDSHLRLYAVWEGDLVSSGTCGDNLTWYFYNGGLLEIKGTGDMYDYKSNFNVPWRSVSSDITSVYLSYGITRIGVFAFFDCRNLKSIEIPSSVTSIGNHSLGYGLINIKIPNSVMTIDSTAFNKCNNLTTINVSENNMYYLSDEDGVLFNKDKTVLIRYPAGKTQAEYIIPDGVTTIGNSAFNNSDNLTSIIIPDSVTNIGNNAFENCSSLTNITILDGVTSIGASAFAGCHKLSKINLSVNNKYYSLDEQGVLFNKDKSILLQYPSGKTLSKYTIPNSVTIIGDSAFSNCDNLIEISIPNSVTTISDSAFDFCDNLTDIIIPDSVTTIGPWVFNGCENLRNIEIPDSVISIGEYAFNSCNNLSVVYYMGTQEQWGKVTIDSGNSSLISSKILFAPKGNVVIKYNDNGGTGGPLDVVVSANSGNVSLSKIVPQKQDCEFVGWSATANTIIAQYQPGDVISVSDGNITLYAIWKKSGVCGSNLIWELYNEKVLVISGTGAMTSSPWYSMQSDITSVIIADGVTFINSYAFYDTAYYKNNDNWDNGVLYIGNHLIKAKSSISGDYTVKSGTLTIADSAFYNCDSLTSIEIPDSVTNIGNNAFEKCSSLTSITIGNGVTSIGNDAFCDCSSLTEITIPDSVTSIGSSAFEYCSNLTSVYISDIPSWLNIKFNGSYANPLSANTKAKNLYINGELVKEVAIPDGVTSIGSSAFYGCSSLTSITIPDSVTSIGYNAFYGCSGLTNVYYTGSEDYWKEISIGSYNSYLTNADIIYLNGMDATISYVACVYVDNKVSATINFNSLRAGTLYLAIYNQGKLVAIKDETVAFGETEKTIEIENADESYIGYDVKVFCWKDSNTLAPLAETFESKVSAYVLESAHPYANGMNETKTYSYDGQCVSIDVTFSADTETETNYDYIYIYDANDNQIVKYSGKQLAGQTINVPGNTVKIRLTSDGSVTKYGYRTESIVVNK